MDFRVAAKSFIVKDNKVLIVKRSDYSIQKPNTWEFPGGRLEIGEDPMLGVQRETKEETGLDIEVLHPINIRHFKRADNQTVTLIVFLCKPLHTNVKLSKEHTAYEWVALENAKDKLADFFHKEIDIFKNLELNKLL